MSTRCNIKLTDEHGTELWFYRHSDGYPEGAMPVLEEFVGLVNSGKIRRDAMQAAGWLILLGADEYGVTLNTLRAANKDTMMGWKVGSIEPTTGQHSDIEWLYHVDLQTGIINKIDI